MEKSDVYKAIIKIKEYCKKQKNCEGCEFLDEYDTGMCLLCEPPEDWDTDDILYNILDEGEGDNEKIQKTADDKDISILC